MKHQRLFMALSALSILALLFGAAPVLAAPGGVHGAPVEVCPGPAAEGNARCFSRVFPDASASPTGLSPATIKSVYKFSTGSTVGAGKTIAIVDAYNDPNAESDLAVFNSQFGLPACTT
ncbi:MAG TPA: hypothetical protein VF806_04420, partial [Anaerolineaceae bacterium]